jgi:hypothetical protein
MLDEDQKQRLRENRRRRRLSSNKSFNRDWGDD